MTELCNGETYKLNSHRMRMCSCFIINFYTIGMVLVILYLFKCFLHLKFKKDAFVFMVS